MLSHLVLQIVPLYIVIFLGYIAGKYFDVKNNDISKLLFYILSPIVTITGIMGIHADVSMLALPVIILVLCSLICIVVYLVSEYFIRDTKRNILAFSSGGFGAGSFGLPIAIVLFDVNTVNIYIVASIGLNLFENSIGFYVAARAYYTKYQCAKKFLANPTLHAFIIGFALRYMGCNIPDFLSPYFDDAKGAFVTLAMMITGIVLSNIKKFFIDWQLVRWTVFIKYVSWPMIMLSIVILDQNVLHFYTHMVHKTLILIGIIPISNTNIMLGSILKYSPDAISVVVLINVIIAIFYVPAMTMLLLYN